jgi:hypothetical protein
LGTEEEQAQAENACEDEGSHARVEDDLTQAFIVMIIIINGIDH